MCVYNGKEDIDKSGVDEKTEEGVAEKNKIYGTSVGKIIEHGAELEASA